MQLVAQNIIEPKRSLVAGKAESLSEKKKAHGAAGNRTHLMPRPVIPHLASGAAAPGETDLDYRWI